MLTGQDSFDYVVLGSGFCAFAFVERIHRRDARARILILEGGTLDYTEHLKNIDGDRYAKALSDEAKRHRWSKQANFISIRFF